MFVVFKDLKIYYKILFICVVKNILEKIILIVKLFDLSVFVFEKENIDMKLVVSFFWDFYIYFLLEIVIIYVCVVKLEMFNLEW